MGPINKENRALTTKREHNRGIKQKSRSRQFEPTKQHIYSIFYTKFTKDKSINK